MHSSAQPTTPPLSRVRSVPLRVIRDVRGNLVSIEAGRDIDFSIARIYYIYDCPQDAARGAHAHKALQQLIIPIAGAFSLTLDDGFNTQKFRMHGADKGLYLPPMIWRDLHDLTSHAVCLVLASEVYDESDYYRSYDDFIKAAQATRLD